MDVERSVDFCVRALRYDGLRVSPFDQHPDGDGSLRKHGIDPETWRSWLTTVLDYHARLKTYSSADDPTRIDHQMVIDLAESFFSPARLCPGSTELQARLEARWVEYEPIGRRWEESVTIDQGGFLHRHLADQSGRIWKGLLPYHDRLSTLNVYLVDYPAPAVLTVRPLTCVIAPDPSDRDGAGYARQVLAAAEALTAS